jgi:hypothetical protein
MNRCRNNTSRTVFMALVVGWGAMATAGLRPQPGTAPNSRDPDLNELFRPTSHWKDPFMEETYRKEGTEVVPWTKETALPGADNAALLYYQAFLLRPAPDDATSSGIDAVFRGAEPNKPVRVYLGYCRAMIHTAEVASWIPQCTWGLRPLDPSALNMGSLASQVLQLTYVLALDARTLAADGHYQAALARCLTMRRMARHIGDDTFLALMTATQIDGFARRTMQYVLGVMPATTDILSCLRAQLAVVPGTPPAFEKAIQADLEMEAESLRQNRHVLGLIRQEIAKGADEERRTRTLSLTDEEIVAQARATCRQSLNGIFRMLDSDMPYEQKYTQIDEQIRRVAEQYSADPAAGELWALISGRMAERYSLFVRNAAGYNALKAAVEVYLVRAQTDQLPATLPAHTPKDSFSRQDFEYETTPRGFVLRCRARDIYENRVWQYEFNVRDSPTQKPGVNREK